MIPSSVSDHIVACLATEWHLSRTSLADVQISSEVKKFYFDTSFIERLRTGGPRAFVKVDLRRHARRGSRLLSRKLFWSKRNASDATINCPLLSTRFLSTVSTEAEMSGNGHAPPPPAAAASSSSSNNPPARMASDYASQSTPQRVASMPLVDIFRDKILQNHRNKLKNGDGNNYCCADYGAAEGVNAVWLACEMLGLLLEGVDGNDDGRDTDSDPSDKRTITMVLEDLPQNDWNGLASHLASPDCPLQHLRKLYGQTTDFIPIIAPTSFYLPCYSPNSVDLGVTNSAVHWLSTGPTPLSNLERQAAQDWAGFWTHRLKELKIGGFMMASFMCHPDSPEDASPACPDPAERLTNYGWIPRIAVEVTRRAFQKGWLVRRAGSKRQGLEVTMEDLLLPLYPRSPAEVLAPFQPPSPLSNRLRIVHLEKKRPPHPVYASFLQHGDSERYAEEHATQMRAFLGWSVPGLWGLFEWREANKDPTDGFFEIVKEILRDGEAREIFKFGKGGRMLMCVERVG